MVVSVELRDSERTKLGPIGVIPKMSDTHQHRARLAWHRERKHFTGRGRPAGKAKGTTVRMSLKLMAATSMASLWAGSARADMFPPSPGCSRPYRPFEFTSQYELDSFKRQVDSYERCIDEFVREQREAAKKHTEAAKDAIDAWNSFVRSLR